MLTKNPLNINSGKDKQIGMTPKLINILTVTGTRVVRGYVYRITNVEFCIHLDFVERNFETIKNCVKTVKLHNVRTEEDTKFATSLQAKKGIEVR